MRFLKKLSFKRIFFVLALALSGCTWGAKKPEVHFATWGHYFSPDVKKEFEEATGIRIRLSHYSSNEELLAKIQAGASGYDLAVPSDYMVEILVKLQLIEKIDLEKIPNNKHLNQLFRSQDYDPQNAFSLPYAWSVTGIVRHLELYSEPIQSWKDLLTNPKLSARVSVLDDARETLGMALKTLGYSYNSKNSHEIKAARDFLIEHRKQIKMFRSEMVDPLIQKEVFAGQAYSTDARQAIKKSNGKVEFVLPKEGTTFAIDNFIIVKGSKNIEQAYTLMNYLYEPRTYAKLIQYIQAGAVIPDAAKYLPETMAQDPLFFPSIQTLEKFERLREVGSFQKEFEKAWAQVKAHRP